MYLKINKKGYYVNKTFAFSVNQSLRGFNMNNLSIQTEDKEDYFITDGNNTTYINKKYLVQA
jgi:hypothetical protein